MHGHERIQLPNQSHGSAPHLLRSTPERAAAAAQDVPHHGRKHGLRCGGPVALCDEVGQGVAKEALVEVAEELAVRLELGRGVQGRRVDNERPSSIAQTACRPSHSFLNTHTHTFHKP